MKKLLTMALLSMAANAALGAPSISVSHHVPMNVFGPEESVGFEVKVKGASTGVTKVTAVVKDFWGKTVKETSQEQGRLELGKLPNGYYELTVTAEGVPATAASFGVVPTVTRTAAEVREGGYRFGMKSWQVDDIWWRRPAVWHVAECFDACARMGLQWTRHQFNQVNKTGGPGIITTDEMLKKPINAVLKIELWPIEFYDTARYDPLADWEAKGNRKGQANRWTVPMKEPYRKWLKGEIEKLPAEQKVFEVGNEPWGKMSPEEWAEYCQLIRGVVKEVRPDAIVGSNHAMYSVEWEDRFIKAGGMEGMDMVTVHPYSFTPLPERRTPASLRNYKDYLRDRLGRDVDLYVTEYGWSTAPQDKRKQGVSERLQAERTTRQSLMLYAEGMKTLIPHWMADREQDPTEREHFFGFFRLAEQPKPVVIAHATCARMIDGSRYVGDLWLGKNIGAMVFEKGGVNTAALWSIDEEEGKTTEVSLGGGGSEVTVVDVMGRERKAKGDASLRISSDVTYVVGIDPALAKAAKVSGQELNPERWSIRLGSVDVPKAGKVSVDGNFDEWAQAKMELKADGGKGAVSGRAQLSWDAGHLYVAAEITDDKLVSAKEGAPLTSGDVLELNLAVRPGRQASLGQFQWYEWTVQFGVPNASGKGAVAMIDRRAARTVIKPQGVESVVTKTAKGWAVEAAIPVSLLKGWNPEEAAVNGEGRIAGCVDVTDVDEAGKQGSHLMNAAITHPLEWPFLVLKEKK